MNEILYKCTRIYYVITRRNVKNINFRIKPDKIVYISAPVGISKDGIEALLIKRGDYILKCFEKFKEQEVNDKATRIERSKKDGEKLIAEISGRIYKLFEPYGIYYPKIKIKKLKSSWGNCYYKRGLINLSERLLEKPEECIEYVILHEFAHLIYPNHSKDFYGVIERFMPDYKTVKKKLEGIK